MKAKDIEVGKTYVLKARQARHDDTLIRVEEVGRRRYTRDGYRSQTSDGIVFTHIAGPRLMIWEPYRSDRSGTGHPVITPAQLDRPMTHTEFMVWEAEKRRQANEKKAAAAVQGKRRSALLRGVTRTIRAQGRDCPDLNRGSNTYTPGVHFPGPSFGLPVGSRIEIPYDKLPEALGITEDELVRRGEDDQ